MNDAEKRYILVDEQNIPHQVFVDGFYGILLSQANSKVGFYQSVGIEEATKKEKRKVIMTVVMPTPAMREFCKKFLAATDRLQPNPIESAPKNSPEDSNPPSP